MPERNAEAAGGLVALSAAVSHGMISEVSPIWTPLPFALLLFILFTWRKGRQDGDSREV